MLLVIRSSASSFSSQYLLWFSNHQGPVFAFLFLSHPSSDLQRHHWRKQFLLRVCAIQWTFLLRILFWMSSFLLYVQELLIFSILLQYQFQSPQNTSAPILLMSRSLSHIKQCSKHNTLTNFFLSSMFSLLLRSEIFLLNASLTVVILNLISLVQ